MNTTRHSLALIRQLIISLAMVSIILLAPAWAILATSGPAAAAPTGSVQPIRHHGGPNYWPITGTRVGAPSEADVSTYGGSHKHLWVEQQLYGPGVVVVPHVDTTVHQSR